MIILKILAVIILVIVLLFLSILVGILLIPFTYCVKAEKFSDYWISSRVSWLFGGVAADFQWHSDHGKSLRLIVLGIPLSIPTENKHRQVKINTASKKKIKEKRANQTIGMKTLLNRAAIDQILSGLKKMLYHLKPTIFQLEARIGSDDPYTTGMLSIVNSMFSGLLKKCSVTVEPDFEKEVLEGRLHIRGRIWMAYLLWTALAILVSKPIRPILIEMIKKTKGS